jgi:hypothetical protein
MSTLFQQASEHVKSLHKEEKWKIEFDSKHGGITALVSAPYAVNLLCGVQQKWIDFEFVLHFALFLFYSVKTVVLLIVSSGMRDYFFV